MSEWKVIAADFDATSRAVFTVTKGSKRLDHREQEELEALLADGQEGLYEALAEAELELMMARLNALKAVKSDQRWEGIAEAIQISIDKSAAARAKARGK